MIKVCTVKIGGRGLKSFEPLFSCCLQTWSSLHTEFGSAMRQWTCAIIRTMLYCIFVYNLEIYYRILCIQDCCTSSHSLKAVKSSPWHTLCNFHPSDVSIQISWGCVLVFLHEIIWVFPAVKKMAPLYAWSALGTQKTMAVQWCPAQVISRREMNLTCFNMAIHICLNPWARGCALHLEQYYMF